MKRLAKSTATTGEPRSWVRLWLEVLATDHPIVWGFLVLIGCFAGGMFSLMFGMGLVLALYKTAFGNMAKEEGLMFPVFAAIYFALAVGMTWLSLKVMATTGEIMGRSSAPVDPIKSPTAMPPSLWDRDLDEAF